MSHDQEHDQEYESLLNDYLDEELSAPEREELELHLRDCAGCRVALADLRSIRDGAAALPATIEPPRDLWPAIQGSLPRRRGNPLSIFLGRGTGASIRPVWLGLGVAAGLAFFVVGISAYLILYGLPAPFASHQVSIAGSDPGVSGPNSDGSPGSGSGNSAAPVIAGSTSGTGSGSGPGAVAAASPGVEPESIQELEAAYLDATEKLQAALRRNRGEVAPAAVAEIERNLKIVDDAIQKLRAAPTDDQGREAREEMFANLYQTKFELLRRAVRLSLRDHQEDQS